MEKQCVLISGPTIANDKDLAIELQKNLRVLTNTDSYQIESTIGENRVDLILLEFPKEDPSEVEIIKNIKSYYPDIEIISIGGDRETIAKAYSYEAKDVFRIPYKRNLIVERVNAILGKLRYEKTFTK